MEVSGVAELPPADEAVLVEMVQKVKVRTDLSRCPALTEMVCIMMHSACISDSAVVRGCGLGAELDVVAEPAPAAHRELHVEVFRLHVTHPAVDIVEIKRLFAVAVPVMAVPVEFAGEERRPTIQCIWINQVSRGDPTQRRKGKKKRYGKHSPWKNRRRRGRISGWVENRGPPSYTTSDGRSMRP